MWGCRLPFFMKSICGLRQRCPVLCWLWMLFSNLLCIGSILFSLLRRRAFIRVELILYLFHKLKNLIPFGLRYYIQSVLFFAFLRINIILLRLSYCCVEDVVVMSHLKCDIVAGLL